MAIFRGVGGSGDSSDNSFLQEVTGQANAASASASAASASASAASASATSALNTELTSASFNTSDGVLTLTKQDGQTVTTDLDGRFLTSYTETNNLSSAVTWANVPNVNITQSSVTQHQAALSITESQISNLQSYLTTHQDITGKANLSGATFTGLIQADGGLLIPETARLEIGDNSFGGNNTYLSTNASGIATLEAYNNLTIRSTNNVTLAGSGNVPLVQGVKSGGQYTVSLYYGPSQERLKTNVNGVAVTGNITVTGTVDGRDVLADGTKLDLIEANATADQTGAEIKSAYEAVADTNAYTDAEKTKLSGIEASADVTDATNVTSAGAAMLTGADFTGDVTTTGNVGIGNDNPTATLDVNGELAIRGGEGVDDARMYFRASDNSNRFTIETDLDGITSNDILGFRSTSTDNILTLKGNGNVGIGNDNPTEALDVDGNIAVSGIVDGRDVAADGAKLDTLERTVRQRFQRRGYNNTVSLNALTTTYSQLGGNLRINSGATTAVENELDLNLTASHLDVNSSNEGLFIVTVDAPDPTTETTVNLGTVTGAAFGVFSVSGNFTKHFSPYCGLSKNSDGSNAINFSNQDGWEYNPATNITTVYIYPYQANTPATGDSVYLHPFDWETTGTEINGDEYPFEAYNAHGTATQNHFHQIYLGYYKPERTFKIKAKETSTGENIQITRVAGTYSQIIGS